MAAMEKKDKTLNVPPLRFPEFSGEWEKELLGTTCKVLMCKRILASQTNSDCGVPFYKIGTIGGVPDAYISKELFESYRAKYNYPRKGEVMITCAGTVGKAMIFDGHDSYYQDSNIVWIDNPTNTIDNTFLYHFISKVDWSKLNTTTIVRIYNDDLRQLWISYPTLSEQRKISIFLNLLNQRIETQKKIIEKYESLIRGLYQFLFQQAKYDHFVSLGDISQISNGNSDVKDASMYNDGSLYPFFDRSDEIKFLPEYLFDKEAIIYPGEGAEFYPRYYNGKFALHQRCYAVYDISADFIPRYLYHYCKTQNSYFVRNAVGSTVASLRLDTFKRLKIPAIPTHHQESLVMFLDKIEAKIECNRTILKKYEEQKKYLLFTLFI